MALILNALMLLIYKHSICIYTFDPEKNRNASTVMKQFKALLSLIIYNKLNENVKNIKYKQQR